MCSFCAKRPPPPLQRCTQIAIASQLTEGKIKSSGRSGSAPGNAGVSDRLGSAALGQNLAHSGLDCAPPTILGGAKPRINFWSRAPGLAKMSEMGSWSASDRSYGPAFWGAIAMDQLVNRLQHLPLILAGPILRRVTDKSVTVWVAIKESEGHIGNLFRRRARG